MRLTVISTLGLLLIGNTSAMALSCTGMWKVCASNCAAAHNLPNCSGPNSCATRLDSCLKTGQWMHGDTGRFDTVKRK
jgi:hypothetical protein